VSTFNKISTSVLLSLVLVSSACANGTEGGDAERSAITNPSNTGSDPPVPPTPSKSKAGSRGTSGRQESARVVDTDFLPGKLVVSAGTTVTWTQVGDQPHSVSSNDDVFESSPDCSPTASDMCLGEGDVFTYTFEKPGTFKYYCRVHGLPDGTGMTGTVVVE
jgi:plastocyanin